MFPGDMPRPPRVSLPEMPGAQILRYETQATTMCRIDGQGMSASASSSRSIRAAAARWNPGAEVRCSIARARRRGASRARRRDRGDGAAGVDPSRPVVATTELKLDQHWKPEPTTAFKAGDALVRTITRQAADIPAMAMLDLAFAAPPGVRVYVDPPQTDDRVERGDLTGRRTDGSPMCSSAAARSRSTPLFSPGGISKPSGCGRRKGPVRPSPSPMWRHCRQPAIALSFGSMW